MLYTPVLSATFCYYLRVLRRKISTMKPGQNRCSKPLGLTELACEFVCVCLLIAIRFFDLRRKTSLPHESLIFMYSTFATLFVVTGISLISQMIRQPLTNTPMVIYSFIASVLSFTAALLSLLQYTFTPDNRNTQGFLHMIVVLGSVSLLGAVIYVVDGMLALKRLKSPPDNYY